jgi:hypothetical protein
MCVTHVRTYVYPDGRKDVIETPEYCPRSVRNQTCKNHRRREYPERAIDSDASDIEAPPPSPVSATPGPRLELRQPASRSSKGKEKVRQTDYLSGGDAVLVNFMSNYNQPEIAYQAEKETLIVSNSDSDSDYELSKRIEDPELNLAMDHGDLSVSRLTFSITNSLST